MKPGTKITDKKMPECRGEAILVYCEAMHVGAGALYIFHANGDAEWLDDDGDWNPSFYGGFTQREALEKYLLYGKGEFLELFAGYA